MAGKRSAPQSFKDNARADEGRSAVEEKKSGVTRAPKNVGKRADRKKAS